MNYAKIAISILVLFISNAYSASFADKCESFFLNTLKEDRLSPQEQSLFVDVANLMGGETKGRLLDALLERGPSLEVQEKIGRSLDKPGQKKDSRVSRLKKSLRERFPRRHSLSVYSAVQTGGEAGIRILEKILKKSPPLQQTLNEIAKATIKIGENPGIRFFKNLLENLPPEVREEIFSYLGDSAQSLIVMDVKTTRFFNDLLKQDLSPDLREEIVDYVSRMILKDSHSEVGGPLLIELLENNPSPQELRIIMSHIPTFGSGQVGFRQSVSYLKGLLENNPSSQTLQAIAHHFANETPEVKADLVGLTKELEEIFHIQGNKEALITATHLKKLFKSRF